MIYFTDLSGSVKYKSILRQGSAGPTFQVRNRIQIPAGSCTIDVFVISCCSDHGCIVCTVDRGWIIELNSLFFASLFHPCTKSRVGSYPACDGVFSVTLLFCGCYRAGHKNINDCILERSCQIRNIDGLTLHITLVDII